MSHVNIHGWRYQSTRRRDIQQQLKAARQHGFQHYRVQRYGQSYWLYCTAEASVDVVAEARSQVDLPAALVVHWLPPWLYAVAWQDEQLLGVLRLPADQGGEASLWQVSQRWLAPAANACELVLVGSDTATALTLPDTSAAPIFHPAIDWHSPTRGNQTVSIRRSLPWLRRWQQVSGVSIIGVMVLVALLSGTFTKQSAPAPILTPPPPLTTAPEEIQPQLVPAELAQRVGLLQRVNYLAGWRVQRWQLTPSMERLWVMPSYGTAAELLLQLPDATQWHWEEQERILSRSLPQLETAVITAALEGQSSLAETGFKVTTTATGMMLAKSEFQPGQDQLLPVFAWLQTQPHLRVTQVTAEQQGLHWHLMVELTT